jgi:hypothetical protein
LKKFTFPVLVSFLFLLLTSVVFGQKQRQSQPKPFNAPTTPTNAKKEKEGTRTNFRRCSTMEELQKAIDKDPSLIEKWRVEGEKQYQAYLQREQSGQRVSRIEANPIIIPIVFHIVDIASSQAWITDRDIYEQVEVLNQDYGGKKILEYTNVIPPEILARIGNINVKFVLARRDPNGALTSGIERRVNASPDHISIKSTATGGLDAWDPTKYVNVWCGTFSGSELGLLGIATFPFTNTDGPQGVVIGLATLPFTSPTTRAYYAQYSEGSTLSHEIGHYFYLWHTFGDQTTCNNADFRIQAGWPLPTGAGPEGDDTPPEKAGPGNAYFGNPSLNHNDGCSPETFGIMYGSYMNYFDDRALFMFSDGQRKRVEGCINLYRPGLLTTNGATPPSPVTDAFLLTVASRGLPERRTFILNNSPFSATVRNNGTTTLTSVTVNVKVDAGGPVPTVFPLNLAAGRDTTLVLANISGAVGNHTYQVYTTSPNGGVDNFLNNDTLNSYYYIHGGAATLPLTESFTSATFPPANWLLFNPNGPQINAPALPATWERNTTSGSGAAGCAYFDNYDVNMNGNFGTLDDLVTPALDLAGAPGALLTFKVAYAPYDAVDVSVWDGLEVYVSGDGGKSYNLAYKKTGNKLATSAATTNPFTATPAEPAKWRTEIVNLTPFIVPGQKMIVKFRNVNAFGNNTYLDDVSITPTTGIGTNDAEISAILTPANGSVIPCAPLRPTVTITNAGTNTLTTATINVQLNGAFAYSQAWNGSLATGGSANVALNTTLNVTTIGTNTIKIYTSLPNGQLDATPANDTATSVITRLGPSVMPVTNSFETTFLPLGWAISNPDNDDLDWFRFNPPAGGSGGSVWAAVIDNYDLEHEGTIDDLITPVVNTSTLLANDSVYIKWDLAYQNYPDPINSDTLKVLISNDCGNTWTTLWAKGGPDLATAGSSPFLFFPNQGDWRTQKLSIGSSLFSSGQIRVAFRNVNEFGNVLWLDNINVSKKPRKDLQTTAVVRPNLAECGPLTPSMTVKNIGEETVTAFKIGYILNGGNAVIQVVNATLAPGASTTVSFTGTIAPVVGNNTIKLFVADPIQPTQGPDLNFANDTLTRAFFVPTVVPNVSQGFEGTTFIPAGWALFNPQNDITWVRTPVGKASDFSTTIDNYDNQVVGEKDIMQPPLINAAGADSLYITFDVAHKDYPGSFDQLRVLVSTNCGSTFTAVYTKSGPTLATAGESTDGYVTPLANEWRSETIRLNNVFTGGNTLIQFENTNDFGNNIFIDNINITPKFKRDIEVLSVTPDVACAAGYTPTVKVHNRGLETVTSFTIAYTVNGGTAITQTVTANIPPDGTTTLTLGAGTLVAGSPNNIRVFTSAPVTASGSGDQYLVNDTLARVTYAAGIVQAPASVSETFEGNFLPTGWALSNADNGITWQKAGTGKNSTGSAYMRNYAYYAAGEKDLLYTPVLGFTGVDSVQLSFDISAATRSFPGATNIGLDTLEVFVTRDCGNTFTSIYKKWGSQLQTVGDANFPQPIEFTPNGPLQWRNEKINLTSYAPNGPLQVVFKNTNNNGNDVYIDNVNFSTVTLPPRLKAEGVIVTPNPFSEQFKIWFAAPQPDIRYVNVLNSSGQLIWKKEFGSGSTSNIIDVNMGGMAAGVYVIKLGYADAGKDKEIRIIKSN